MNLLPEYNEIIYHVKVLSELEFREYWNEVQSRQSPSTVTDEDIKEESIKMHNGYSQKAFIRGCKWMRDKLTKIEEKP